MIINSFSANAQYSDLFPIFEIDSNKLFEKPEQVATYIEGNTEMYKIIKKNLNIKGRINDQNKDKIIYVSCVIYRDGSMCNVKIARGFDAVLETECLKSLKFLKKWKAAVNKYEMVSSIVLIPIKFTLESGQEEESE